MPTYWEMYYILLIRNELRKGAGATDEARLGKLRARLRVVRECAKSIYPMRSAERRNG